LGRVRVRSVAGKTLEVEAEGVGGKISKLIISGDFFADPEDAVDRMEKALLWEELNKERILKVLEGLRVQLIGVTLEELADAILEAAGRSDS